MDRVGWRCPEHTAHCRVLISVLVSVFLWCLLPVYLFGAGQHVTIRFLDPKSGKPIRNMWVGVTQYKDTPPKGPIPAEYRVSFLSAKTNQKGEVIVALHDPLPTFLSVNADIWYSGSLIPVDDILKSGVILDYSRKGAPQGHWTDDQGHPGMNSGSLLNHSDKKEATPVKFALEPGVIVFVEKKITTGERVGQEIP